MSLVCPQCHKHHFKVWGFLTSGFNRDDDINYPVVCPHCNARLKFANKSANVINLITLAALFGYLALAISLFHPQSTFAVVIMAVVGVAIGTLARALAIARFGSITPYEIKDKHKYRHIRLDEVRSELDWLETSKSFFVLFTPDESKYLSFGLEGDIVLADLAFANGKLEELKPRFVSAVERAGAKSQQYYKRGMRGYEARLGSNVDEVSAKIQKIMRDMFHLKGNAEIPVMRAGES